MNEQQLLHSLRTLNDSEIFYRNYRLAKSSPDGFDEYLFDVEHVNNTFNNFVFANQRPITRAIKVEPKQAKVEIKTAKKQVRLPATVFP